MQPSDAELLALSAALGKALAARGATIATAESCTGGWLGKALTDVAGSSQWYLGGLVVYANAAKQMLAGVPAELLARHGAVSQPVVRALAEAARTRLGGDFGVAVSGVAGPGGGTAEKPAGFVWFAWASKRGTVAESRRFSGDREAVRRAAVAHAFERLLTEVNAGG